jgi:lysozyme
MSANKYGATAKWMLVCASLVGGFEGCWLTAKPDKLAYGIPTVCHGETEGVKIGDTYTRSECTEMLAKKLPRYWNEIARCIKVETSDHEKIAYTSTSYNIGSAGFCRSTIVRKLNAGDHIGACNALMAFVHAGGKYVQGLANRRAKERTICLTPDSAPVIATVPLPIAKPKLPPVPEYKPLVCTGWWNFLKSVFTGKASCS